MQMKLGIASTSAIICLSWFVPLVIALLWRTLSDVTAPVNLKTWVPGIGLLLFHLALLFGLLPPASVVDIIDLLDLLGHLGIIESN